MAEPALPPSSPTSVSTVFSGILGNHTEVLLLLVNQLHTTLEFGAQLHLFSFFLFNVIYFFVCFYIHVFIFNWAIIVLQ